MQLHKNLLHLSMLSFVSLTSTIFSDGHVLIFEAQKDDAAVSLWQVASFKVGDGAVLSLFWLPGSTTATNIQRKYVANIFSAKLV
jgi:hypothetical protein